MPKSKAGIGGDAGDGNLIDANAMAATIGFTPQYVNRLAASGKIPWHGMRNGAKVYRRYDKSKVLAALEHGVKESDAAPKK
jgi:hypothetical protein